MHRRAVGTALCRNSYTARHSGASSYLINKGNRMAERSYRLRQCRTRPEHNHEQTARWPSLSWRRSWKMAMPSRARCLTRCDICPSGGTPSTTAAFTCARDRRMRSSPATPSTARSSWRVRTGSIPATTVTRQSRCSGNHCTPYRHADEADDSTVLFAYGGAGCERSRQNPLSFGCRLKGVSSTSVTGKQVTLT